MRRFLVTAAVLVFPLLLSAAPVTTPIACGGGATGYAVFASGSLGADQFGPGAGGCIEGDKRFYDFQLNSGSLPAGYKFFFSVDPVDGENIYSVIIGGGPTFQQKFSFTYTAEVYPVSAPYDLTLLSGDLTVIGTNKTPTVTTSATAYDGSGGLLGGCVGCTFSFSGSNRPGSAVLPAGTKKLVVTDSYVPNSGAISQLNNGLTQSAVPEPATFGLIGVGLSVVGVVRRRLRV